MKLIKILNSKEWDLLPFAGFVTIAIGEGSLYWLGGVLAIVWLFTVAIRVFVK